MKLFALTILMAIYGNGSICMFDGWNYSCYFYDWPSCEQAAQGTGMQCVPNPERR